MKLCFARARLLCFAIFLPFLATACRSFWCYESDCEDGHCPGHARVCEKPTIRALAHDLDSLDRHIERYGSIVIQHPSVWGQARLTKHREDFENVMRDELCKFEATLQGALSRSDQAYFSNSLALGVAASGQQAMVTQATAPANANVILTPNTIPTPDAATPFTLTQNAARLPASLTFDTIGAKGISLEPTVYLNQKARYLNHLNELRRINEGDDTGDSPGYALNLIRVPVSVLPGKHTQEGYGAEVTMTLKPYLSSELLPTTFRNLVLNDLLEVIGVPLTQFLNDKEQVKHFQIMEQIYDLEYDKYRNWSKVRRLDYSQLKPESQKLFRESPIIVEMTRGTTDAGQLKAAMKNFREIFKHSQMVVSTTKLRQSRRPFPPTQMLEIFGSDETDNVISRAIKIFKQRETTSKFWVHYPDVQGHLREELAGANRFLSDPAHIGLWEHCSQELVSAIHTRKIESITKIRDRFADQVMAMTKRDITDDVTVAFAWATIVESALLNDRLVEDMKEAAAAKNCPCPTPDWQPYFLPAPPQEARDAFNRYVECRWPMIVFALDPVADQQNIADSFSSRREMQLALSLGFVSGNISARNMMKFARRLELEAETISLNNTVTSFSHGNETFGWRFQPRFQTPDTDSNLTVFFRDQLIGGPNRRALLRQRKLEPGQRECTAIVIMPSFVPYATLETSSTWFKLTNPKCKDMTCVDAVKLSARVKAIENCSPNVIDANCYRDGELERLMNRAKQLEARLPLQSAKVQVPYENTLGGFAMFNTGITDLAPELYGWYGAPGINTNGTTTLFLIGNHFSVHQTKVIVGGIDIVNKEMLSRQVMRVTIPSGALTFDRKTGTFPECPPAGTECPCPVAEPKTEPDPKVAELVFADFTSASEGAQAASPAPKSAPPAPKTTPDPKPTPDPKANVAAKPCAAKPCAVTTCKDLFVQVHIATPYGVTSHLLVPACAATTCQSSAADACTPLAPACPKTCLYCTDNSTAQTKAATDAKARRLVLEAANKKATDDLKAVKDAADTKAAGDLTKAMTDFANKAKKEQDDYKKTVDARLKAIEDATNRKNAAAPATSQPVIWPVLTAPPTPEFRPVLPPVLNADERGVTVPER